MLFDDKKNKDQTASSTPDDDDIYEVAEEKMATLFDDEEEAQTAKKIVPPKAPLVVESQILEAATESIIPITISKEMQSSFLDYAMSVIVSRALPDARDGLKPVHRRILYAMSDLGMTSASPHKKSARIVGEVLGKYHPHGDAAAYQAMVRMAQDFSMRYPLIDGHGNFGSIDGDGAAAMRYTEARMSKISALLVEGLKKNTVDFVDNYDASEIEPSVLPAGFPNLLVSGSSGIAVGMATNIPPHNLGEIIDGVIALVHNPAVTISELMTLIKGPDFPTYAMILGNSGIIKAYETGNGSVRIRSKTAIEVLKNGKSRIIVTEIPYMVNKARMIEKIAILARDKTIEGITDLRDESSRKGIRVVIELRRDVVAEVILNKLFKLTQLQNNFGINLVALVKGEPKVLNLKKALTVYLEHQIEIVTRKTQFDLDKALARAHILVGLKIAISKIDAVIKIIRGSKSDADAQVALCKAFSLSEIQAKAITDMRLGRLTGLAIEKMELELTDLKVIITKLHGILDNKAVLLATIVTELEAVKAKFADPRRTIILEGAFGEINEESLIPEKEIAITMSSRGYVKRIPIAEYKLQNRGGVGARAMTTYDDDDVESILVTTTHIDLLIFTTFGKVYRLRAYQIPELSKQAKGIPFQNLIGIAKNEKVVSLLAISDYNENRYLVTITKNGIIKKTSLLHYARINKNGKIALGLKADDMLLKAMLNKADSYIVIGASNGKLVKFLANQVRPMGRTAAGVKGINLVGPTAKAVVVGADTTQSGDKILSIGKDGFGKMTAVEEYRTTKRGAKGVKSINVRKAGALVAVKVVKGTEDIMVITKAGITIRMSLRQVATSSRATKGVKMIRLANKNTIKSVAIIPAHSSLATDLTEEIVAQETVDQKIEV